jgi:hypothetical protein
MDDLATFVHQLPTWCGPDGLPRSWRHYCHGMAYLARAHHRRQLEAAEAARMGAADADSFGTWHRDTTRYVTLEG